MSAPHLDDLLTLQEAARLWRISPRELAVKSKGPRAPIPGYWINRRLVRFHPRAMFARAAQNAGMSPELIAAMFDVKPKQEPTT